MEEEIEQEPEEEFDGTCPLCDGEGVLDELLDIKCNLCKGKGWVKLNEEDNS